MTRYEAEVSRNSILSGSVKRKKRTLTIDQSMLKPGDVIVTGDNSLLGKIVRRYTIGKKERKNVWLPTHVGLVMQNPATGEYGVLESRGGKKNGIQLNRLTDYTKRKSDRYMLSVLRFQGVDPSVAQAKLMYYFNLDNKTPIRYDYWGAIAFAKSSKGFLPWVARTFMPNQDSNKLYCSEFVRAITMELGVKYPKKTLWSPYDCDKFYGSRKIGEIIS